MGLATKNILQRQFKTEVPCEKQVTDITEPRAGGQELYLFPILGLFNEGIAAWETACRPTEELVKRMLDKGLESLTKGEKLLLHSDQGWCYRIKSYQSVPADRGLVQSMSRKGSCLDNVIMEDFFGHLKKEMYYRRGYRNAEELENTVNECMTHQNQKRIKLNLGGPSPVEYRAEYQKAGQLKLSGFWGSVHAAPYSTLYYPSNAEKIGQSSLPAVRMPYPALDSNLCGRFVRRIAFLPK